MEATPPSDVGIPSRQMPTRPSTDPNERIRDNRVNPDENFKALQTVTQATTSYPTLEMNSVSPKLNTQERKFRHAGLVNLGNTCYMNSGLQCLASIDELVNYFREDHSEHEGKEFVKTFGILLKQIQVEESGSINPEDFYVQLKKRFCDFDNKRQHDAQEFISRTLDHIHEETKDTSGSSIVTSLFEGVFAKNFTCASGHTWRLDEKFMELSLPIPERCIRNELEAQHFEFLDEDELTAIRRRKSKVCKSIKSFLLGANYGAIMTLHDCLKINSILSTSDIICDQCRATSSVKLRTEIGKAPKILMITLKRFVFKRKSSKIKSFVFLPKTLQIMDTHYKLISFLSHSGSISRGHYRAFVQLDGENWQLMNDERGHLINRIQAQEENAYVAFYQLM
mmetsp:Transcript_16579/g.29842  ORF Transcript_16579/g.29842 Transcript_16579/m.29842 type:complete len:395 (+) Transcript_16579:41-1225(+)